MLTLNQFHILLRHKYLNVKKEEEVLIALLLWMMKNEAFGPNVKDLLEKVNWGFLSIHSILEIVRNFPQLRSNPTFQKHFNSLFSLRLSSKKLTELPRYSYRYVEQPEVSSPFLPLIIEGLLEQRDDISNFIGNKQISGNISKLYLHMWFQYDFGNGQ